MFSQQVKKEKENAQKRNANKTNIAEKIRLKHEKTI